MIRVYLDFALERLHDRRPREIECITPEKVNELARQSTTLLLPIDFDRFQQIMKIYLEITNNITKMTDDFNLRFPYLKHPLTGEAHFVTKADGWVNVQPMYLYKMMDRENRDIFVQWMEELVNKT